jgi:hypothetical protein
LRSTNTILTKKGRFQNQLKTSLLFVRESSPSDKSIKKYNNFTCGEDEKEEIRDSPQISIFDVKRKLDT